LISYAIAQCQNKSKIKDDKIILLHNSQITILFTRRTFMTKLDLKPWEMANDVNKKDNAINIPPLCVADFLLVKLTHPKDKSVRDGLVGTFLMTDYYKEDGTKINTISVTESPEGNKITFPLGKRGLQATKFRGPTNYYRFWNPEKKKFYEIPREKFTVDYAVKYLSESIKEFNELSDIEKDPLIDEYLLDMFLYGLSQDLVLPIKGEQFEHPVVGMKTKLYREYTPPAEGERWPTIIASKWIKGQPGLDGAFELVDESLALQIYSEFQSLADESTKFDPTEFVEENNDEII
jgi:hypothetical protein